MITSKRILLTATLIVLTCGAVYVTRLAEHHEDQLTTQRKKVDRLLVETRQARVECEAAKQSVAASLADFAPVSIEEDRAAAWLVHLSLCSPSPQLSEGERVRIWLANLRNLKQLLAQHPEQQIPELKLLTDKDWLQVAQSAALSADDLIHTAFATLREMAKEEFAHQVRDALKKYTEASGGELPADTAQLLPYGTPPLDAAMLERYAMARSGKVGSINEWLVVEKLAADDAHEGRLSISLTGSQSEAVGVLSSDDNNQAFQKAMAEFAKAHNGVMPTEPEQLQPYLENSTGLDRPASPPNQATTSSSGFVDVTPALTQELQLAITLATEAYARAHQGQMPAQLSPEELRPYAKDPAKIDEFLRILKAEGEKHAQPGR